MSLKAFHVFFVLFCTLFGLGIAALGQKSQSSLLFFSGIALVVLLIPYAFWFLKKSKQIMVVGSLVSMTVFSQDLLACSVCFGDPANPLILGIKSGILILITCIGGVLAAILGIGISWARKAKSLESS